LLQYLYFNLTGEPMDLIYKNEKTLFGIMLALSVLLWIMLVIGTVGLALVYGLLFFLVYCFAQSALISHIKGTGVQITAQQCPDLHRQIAACCEKLGLDEQPEAYLMQMGGAFNAFATRFFGRDFLVLYSDVVDALADNPDALNFYIGHEIGHIKRKHLKWSTVLLPASVLPLIGAAYSRAREYTCDRHGLAACDNAVNAEFGMATLAAGGKRWRTMSKTAYIGQSKHTDGFWMSFHELIGDYPWLVKRMGAVRALARGQEPRQPSRHPMAVLLALFVPRFGIGGGGGLIVTVAVVGMLAAVAIPAYQEYVQKAQVAAAYMSGRQASAAVEKYYFENKRIPATLQVAGAQAQPAGNQAVELIQLSPESAEISVLTRIVSAHGQGVLKFTPTLDENKRMVWKCSAQGLREQVLPPACR
jgi:Zn-dependent protease with chaperone function/Tfp pilus assembly protein PilE